MDKGDGAVRAWVALQSAIRVDTRRAGVRRRPRTWCRCRLPMLGRARVIIGRPGQLTPAQLGPGRRKAKCMRWPASRGIAFGGARVRSSVPSLARDMGSPAAGRWTRIPSSSRRQAIQPRGIDGCTSGHDVTDVHGMRHGPLLPSEGAAVVVSEPALSLRYSSMFLYLFEHRIVLGRKLRHSSRSLVVSPRLALPPPVRPCDRRQPTGSRTALFWCLTVKRWRTVGHTPILRFPMATSATPDTTQPVVV